MEGWRDHTPQVSLPQSTHVSDLNLRRLNSDRDVTVLDLRFAVIMRDASTRSRC
jgi:hypothetical protein